MDSSHRNLFASSEDDDPPASTSSPQPARAMTDSTSSHDNEFQGFAPLNTSREPADPITHQCSPPHSTQQSLEDAASSNEVGACAPTTRNSDAHTASAPAPTYMSPPPLPTPPPSLEPAAPAETDQSIVATTVTDDGGDPKLLNNLEKLFVPDDASNSCMKCSTEVIPAVSEA